MLLICESAAICESTFGCPHSKPHEERIGCGKPICHRSYLNPMPARCIQISENTQEKTEMNETKIGYKVVLNDNENKLVSASVGSGKVIYAKDITVKPRMWGGPLTVFFSKFRAIGFIATLSDEKRDKCSVYKCEYEPTKAMSVWRLKDLMIDSKPLCDLPEGTALAKSVTLKEKIFG